jgi:PAS domain S-box-containing protein
LIGLGALIVATAIRWSLELAFNVDLVPYPTYFPAILITAFVAGARAGAFTLVGGGVIGCFLFQNNPSRFFDIGLESLLSALLYLASGSFVLVVALAYRRTLGELRAIYDNAPIGLAVLDKELRFKSVNVLLAKANGLSISEHIGKRLEEVVPDIAPRARSIFEKTLKDGEPVFGLRLSGKTNAGTGHWLENITPLR